LIVTAVSAAATLAIGGLITLRSGDKLPRRAPSVTEPAQGQPPPAPPQPAPTPAPSPAPPGRNPTSDIQNAASPGSPRSAKLWIDEAELPGNPFAGSYHSDTRTHHVRVAAPGYITKIEPITFDANVKLDLSLERIAPPEPSPPAAGDPAAHKGAGLRAGGPPAPVETPHPIDPAPPPPPPRAPAKPPTPAVPADVNPAGGRKPVHPIDSTNPYGGSGSARTSGRPIDPSNPYGGP